MSVRLRPLDHGQHQRDQRRSVRGWPARPGRRSGRDVGVDRRATVCTTARHADSARAHGAAQPRRRRARRRARPPVGSSTPGAAHRVVVRHAGRRGRPRRRPRPGWPAGSARPASRSGRPAVAGGQEAAEVPPDGHEVDQLADGEDPASRASAAGPGPATAAARARTAASRPCWSSGTRRRPGTRPAPNRGRRGASRISTPISRQPSGEQAGADQVELRHVVPGQGEDVPDRAEVAAAVGVERPEAQPGVRGQDQRRQVDHDPS